MRIVDIITTKRDGGELSRDEIEFFIKGYVAATCPTTRPRRSAWPSSSVG